MPMSPEEIKSLILAGIPDAQIQIVDLVGDSNHYQAEIVSPSFTGKSKVQQHQMVYQTLGSKMGNELHALSLKTSDQ